MARTTRAAQFPDLTDTSPAGIRAWARAVADALAKVTGQSANTSNAALDQAVTFRALIDAGFAIPAPAGSGVPVIPGNDPGYGVTSPPPSPGLLVVTRLPFNVRLTWPAPDYGYHDHTEVWRSATNNLTNAQRVTDVPDGVTFYEDGFVEGSSWFYWIRFVSKADQPGGFNAISGTSDNSQPGDVTGFAYTPDVDRINLRWNLVADKDIDYYELRVGASWAAAVPLPGGQVKGNSYPWSSQAAGTYRLWIAARDVTGFYSGSPVAQDITVAPPGVATISQQLIGNVLTLSYTASRGTYAITDYEVRYGTSWASATFVDRTLGLQFQATVNWLGVRRYWVAARDPAGNYATPASVDVSIIAPGVVQGVRADVVDNNVLLYWTAPATGSLPIDTYELRRGATFGGSTLIGEKSGLFTTVFEQASGTYTYWLRAKDTAGNYGTEVAVTQRVNQPPDFVLYADQNLDFALATINNGLLLDGSVILPYYGTQTWDASYTTYGWTNDQDAITAGYGYYANPVPVSSYIEFVADFGVSIPPTSLTTTPTYDSYAGVPTLTTQLSYKLNSGDPWTDLAAGASGFVPVTFRYVKTRLSVASSGFEYLVLRSFNLKLNTKQRTLSGAGTCNSGDSGGTRFVLTQDGTDIAKIGNNTSGQKTITGLASTSNLAVGMSCEGTGVQSGSIVQSVDSSSQVTLNKVTTAGTTGGTYRFGQSVFIDLIGPPVVQPKGTTAIIAVVDFVDDVAPLSFKVLLFNTSGTRVTADISWTGRGV